MAVIVRGGFKLQVPKTSVHTGLGHKESCLHTQRCQRLQVWLSDATEALISSPLSALI